MLAQKIILVDAIALRIVKHLYALTMDPWHFMHDHLCQYIAVDGEEHVMKEKGRQELKTSSLDLEQAETIKSSAKVPRFTDHTTLPLIWPKKNL